MKPIYLDYNATTPIDPAVLEAMLPFLKQEFGNPSSSHAYGQAAHDAMERGRAQLAALIGAEPDEIVFTGDGTEASNQAIKGAAFGNLLAGRKAHIIISTIEHPATVQPCEFLKRFGCAITAVPADRTGLIDPDSIRKTITPDTALISIMHSNNEVGTLEPIREIAAIARERGILMHTDAAQSLGKVPVKVNELGVDLMTIAGHKLYAPKGIGALYIRRGVKLESFIHGAGHEQGRRAGTENVPYIVGLGAAAEIAMRSLPAATEKLRTLRDRLEQKLRQRLGDRIILNGHRELRLPNTLNSSFLGWIGGELLEAVPGIAASTGSACHAGKIDLSPVLMAMGISPLMVRSAVRLSVGRYTTEEEVDRAADLLAKTAAA